MSGQILQQLQKTKSKWLEFEDICELWARKVASGYLGVEQYDSHRLSLHMHSQCIVGEAYGFNPDDDIADNPNRYGGCKDCERYSMSLNGNSDIEEIFTREKDNFVKHWNTVHAR